MPRVGRPLRPFEQVRHPGGVNQAEKWEWAQWQRLVAQLDVWTAASAEGRGRIRVAAPHGEVVVVMTPREWEEMAGITWGDFDSAVEDVKRTLLRLQPHQGFAVYQDYQLNPSVEPMLPGSTDTEPISGGEWVALDEDARVSSRFSDSTNQDPDS